MGKFAEGTTVPVSKSRTELEKLALRFGASKFMVAIDGDSLTAAVQFFMRDRMVRLSIKLPNPKDKTALAEERRRWRSLLALVKAKLVAVDDGIVEFEEEFLASVVTADGSTVYERARESLALEYKTGKPQVLLGHRP